MKGIVMGDAEKFDKLFATLERIETRIEDLHTTQKQHTEEFASLHNRLETIDNQLGINCRYVCGAVTHSLQKIEQKINVERPTDFSDELHKAKEAVLGY